MVQLTAIRPSPSRRALAVGALGVVMAALGIVLVLRERSELSAVLTHADLTWVLLACAATVVSLLAAVRNLTAFTPLRLPTFDTLRAQLAVCGIRVIAPSAVSTPAICARYLSRSGMSTADALAVVGTAQAAQLAMTIVVVGALAASGVENVNPPDPVQLAIWGAAALALLGVIFLVGRRIPVVRRAKDAAVHGVRKVMQHARRRPLTILSGLAASAALTLAHVSAFACCVTAVGAHASVVTLTAIYLAAASAGSLIPTPAGLGAVEATMIAGLVAAGLSGGTATAAALLTRVITVWALAPPGWLALRSLRRRGLL